MEQSELNATLPCAMKKGTHILLVWSLNVALELQEDGYVVTKNDVAAKNIGQKGTCNA